jgi:hypothetical protein
MPDGSPAGGVEVLMGTVDRRVFLSNGVNGQPSRNIQTTTDAEGRFALAYADSEYTLVCSHDLGWAEVDGAEFDKLSEIVLQPWGHIEGKLMRGSEPMAEQRVYMYMSHANFFLSAPYTSWYSSVRSDQGGHFTMDRVPSGTAIVRWQFSYDVAANGSRSGIAHQKVVKVEAGETQTVQLGGAGRRVTGQITVADDYEADVYWPAGSVQLIEYDEQDSDRTDEEARNARQLRRSCGAALSEDGKFEIYDVLPGKYTMAVNVYPSLSQVSTNSWQPIGTLEKTITIPEAGSAGKDGPVDVGTHVVDFNKQKNQQ